MKKQILAFIFAINALLAFAQDFQSIDINSEVTTVQPMTGIVFWPGNPNINTDAIALEYSYMNFADIAIGEGQYDWTVVEDLLDEIASRNHQAVLRFRYTYPGRTTNVPQYIKDLPDYEETEGLSEGQTTFFPDWRHPKLQEFTLDFYTKYAARYDNDPRLAFVQVGFGLWAEYHIYDGPFELGRTFPSKEFQKTFFKHLDSVFTNTYWSISIDAADDTYSPFGAAPEFKNLTFGLFDDSFMHENHGDYNTASWNFFDRNRYQTAPAGGEFSYYSKYDQEHVLKRDVGAYGVPYELFAQDFHITYINGNDQTDYHPLTRIKEASMNSGYKFKLLSVRTKPDSTIIEVTNRGVAPIYVDAYLTVNDVRSSESLKLLLPDEKKLFHVAAGGEDIKLTIESDAILPTETIQFFGTVNEYLRYGETTVPTTEQALVDTYKVYPTLSSDGRFQIKNSAIGEEFDLAVFDALGKLMVQKRDLSTSATIDLSEQQRGVYFITLTRSDGMKFSKKVVFQ